MWHRKKESPSPRSLRLNMVLRPPFLVGFLVIFLTTQQFERQDLEQKVTKWWYLPQGPTVQHRELCSIICGSLDGRGVWARMDTCVCMVEHFCCPPETITTLFVNQLYPNIKVKKNYNSILNLSSEAGGTFYEYIIGRFFKQGDNRVKHFLVVA